MEQLLNQIKEIKEQIQATVEKDAEAFRIKYLGTKGFVKAIMAEMKNVAAENKKEAGQKLNEFKLFVEEKYEELKQTTDNGQQTTANQIDLTLPGDAIPLGSRHPISLVKIKSFLFFNA